MNDEPRINESESGDEHRHCGSGPVSGVIEVSDRFPSVAAFLNHRPYCGIRTWHDGVKRLGDVFVFDPVRCIFAVGDPQGISGSPHQKLARAIGVTDYDRLVGGTWTREADGALVTTEQSGHFGDNWSRHPEVRRQFVEFLERRTGLSVRHEV